jgi:proteasome inhibitor subunit 1 (PI31)
VVSNVTFDVAVVKAEKGALATLVPTISEVLDRLRKELIEPVFNGQKKDTQTQTPTQPTPRPDVDPLRYEPGGVRRPDYRPGFEDLLRSIGRRDLDPLAQGGGGMIVSFGRFC